MSIEDIKKLEDSATVALQQLHNCMRDAQNAESDIKRLLAIMNVKVMAWPDQPIFRVRDQRMDNHGSFYISSDADMAKDMDFFTEEIIVENISFERKHNNDQKNTDPFKIVYHTTGYYQHRNQYNNGDFGMIVFTNKTEFLAKVTPLMEQAKIHYKEKKEREATEKKAKLLRELEELEKPTVAQ